MDEKEIKFIQDQIGYTFKNQELLVQAFTRRSYSMENGKSGVRPRKREPLFLIWMREN